MRSTDSGPVTVGSDSSDLFGPSKSHMFVSGSDDMISEYQADLDRLPKELKTQVLQHLPYEHIFRLRSLSKSWKAFIDALLPTLMLRESPSSTSTLTACYFFLAHGEWQWAGFDPTRGKWRRLRPLTPFLPPHCAPDLDLFKEFLVCSKAELVCVNFSKSPAEERLVVFNPLSGQWRELPLLILRRNPVLMHMLVHSNSKSYQLVEAGSSRSGDEASSKITELCDSKTGEWEKVSDIPGPAFAVNEYQSGVYRNGHILGLGFVELQDGQAVKGCVGFNVAERRWWASPLPGELMSCTILQLVESSGQVYLFSERETAQVTEQCIDRLDFAEGRTCHSVNVMKQIKKGGRSLEVYPEVALVPFGEFQLCVYNTVDHSGEVYDMRGQGVRTALPVLPGNGFRNDLGFFSLNPMSFVVEPRFSSQA